ncbi:hypothetical protein [Candidatus Skiveiella danica]|uniref:hypothetical protein n=1 Tax=Candidatus Skiveiella danica TaxID=3386177 RepID=UPI0039B95D86
MTIWHGLYAPKGTPADVAAKINAALKGALKDPEFIKEQEVLGALVVTRQPHNAGGPQRFVTAEIGKMKPGDRGRWLSTPTEALKPGSGRRSTLTDPAAFRP